MPITRILVTVLKTARQPKWIALLVLALLVVTVFVVMSAWQFGEARSEPHVNVEDTETPQPLADVFEPEMSMTVAQADQIVTFRGSFVPETQVLVTDRLQDDNRDGYWAVAAFEVDQAPDDQVIPVVRGWVEDSEDASIPPTGELELQGRLIPTEAPGPGPRELPAGQLPTLSVAELINLWELDSYSGFVVDFSEESMTASEREAGGMESVVVGTQPETSDINYLNLFYGIEWMVFAGFAFYLWWRLVKDAHMRELEEERLDEEWAQQWRAQQLQERENHTAQETPAASGSTNTEENS